MNRHFLAAGLAIVAGLSPAAAGSVAGVETPHIPEIDKVFFAQHHVLAPNNPLFKLVGDLEALIKVQVYADTPVPSPDVFARLEFEGTTRDIRLTGPERLPRRPDCDPVLMPHSYDDSFTAMIPGQWIKPGLKVTVELRDYDYTGVEDDDTTFANCVAGRYVNILDRVVFDDLRVGAPTRLVMQMFDVHYFGRGRGADLPTGWQEELEARLPVSELTVHRVKDVVFNDIVMPPLGKQGIPSARYSGVEDYKRRTGLNYDGEQGIALKWGSALKAAGGRFQHWRPYHINICGVAAGGQAGGYRSCSSIHRHGVIIHELGHTFGLPHWLRNKHYPYKRTMYGAEEGEPCIPNVGPTWAYDLNRRRFLAPYKIIDGRYHWDRDPMQGGGKSTENDRMFRFFSDYSVHKIQQCFEDRAAYWNELSSAYARWDHETGGYHQVIENDGILFPVERDLDVISLLVSANLVVPEANIVYPPIGPYKAGVIERFDAGSRADRQKAVTVGFVKEDCNVALRVTQGGKTRSYLMPVSVSPEDDPLKTFNAAAINLPARDGDITKAELVYCPELMTKGVSGKHRILDTWSSGVLELSRSDSETIGKRTR